jgi:hypothetical protein
MPLSIVGPGALRPHRTRTPCEWLADRMPVATREASALNLTPFISSLCRCRGLEQHYVIASVSGRFLGNKDPPASGSSPSGDDEFSHDAFARATRPVPENRAVPDVQPPRAPADVPRLSGHERTS